MKKIAGVVPGGILDQHVAILGKTRSGKSSVMRQLVEALLEAGKPVCIVDPKGDWWGIKLAADGKGPGYPVVIFGGEHNDVPINEHAGAHVAELFATGNRPCLIDLGGWTVGARTRFWIDFASTLFKLTKGNRYLAVDEFHNFCPKGKVMDADAGKMLHWSNRLMSEGLGKGLNMLIASQRPQKVHNDSLTSAETLIAMRVLHPSDRGAVSDWIKGCGDGSGDQVLNSLGQMDRGEGWVWSPEIGFGPTRVKFPLFSTYDSFRPQTVEDTKRLKGWAEVDLDEVRAKLDKVVEEAKANDPRELKRKITKLQKELSERARLSVQAIEREPLPPSKPALTDADRALIEKVATAINGVQASMRERFTKADDGLKRDIETSVNAHIETVRRMALNASEDVADVLEKVSVKKLLEKLNGLAATPAPSGRPIFQNQKTDLPTSRNRTPTSTSSTSFAPRTPSAGDSNGDLKLNRLAERKVLQVLSQFGPRTVRQLAIQAGYAQSGGGFRGAISKLRAAGYLTSNGALYEVTDAGRNAIGNMDPLPTGSALVAYWMQQFNRLAEREVLRVIVDAYPKAITAEDIASKTNPPYEPNGGGFRGALGKLRTLGLIDGRGELRASDDLFDGASG